MTEDKGTSPKSHQDIVYPLVLVVLLVLIALPVLMSFPVPGGDEPGFIDPSIQLLRRGQISTTLYGDLLPGSERHIYWQPPLYFVVLAGWFGMFGVGLLQARLLSLACAAIALAIYYRIARRAGAPPWAAALAIGLALTSIWYQTIARVARMDSLTVLLVGVTWLVYIRDTQRLSAARAAAVGFLAGLSLLSHPLGAIAAAPIGLHLLLARPRFLFSRGCLVMVAGGLLPLIAWGIYIAQDYPSFASQMAQQFARKASSAGSRLRLLLQSKNYALALLLLASGWVGVVLRSLRMKQWRFPALAAFFSIAASVYGAETTYYAYLVLPAAVCLALVIGHVAWRRAWVVACVVAISIHGVIAASYFHRARQQRSFATVNEELRRAVPPGEAVLWPTWGLSPYFALAGQNPVKLVPPIPLPQGIDINEYMSRFRYVAVNHTDQLDPRVLNHRPLLVTVTMDGQHQVKVFGPPTTKSVETLHP